MKWYTMDIHGYVMYILCGYTMYILGYTLCIHYKGYTWYIQGYTMYIPYIYHTYGWGHYMYGIYQAYTRHIPKIGVPDSDGQSAVGAGHRRSPDHPGRCWPGGPAARLTESCCCLARARQSGIRPEMDCRMTIWWEHCTPLVNGYLACVYRDFAGQRSSDDQQMQVLLLFYYTFFFLK